MRKPLVALVRALVTTAVVFGPLVVALRMFSWQAPVAGAFVVVAVLIYGAAALAAGGEGWIPDASPRAILAAGALLIVALGVGAFWLAGHAAPYRPGALLAGYAALAWAIAGHTSVRTAWYHVLHPEQLARYIVAKRRLREVMRATLAPR
ncbi:MAG: hypothetical protein ACJ8AO_04295 [Gemmatimonadaceae bacterium]